MVKEKDMSNTSKLNRVASNSVLLFVRVVILAIINLYTVRLAFTNLGKEDYGLYNALSGVVTLSVIIVTLFALPIQRFFSYSIGVGKKEKISDIFSSSVNLIVFLCILIFVLFETFGVSFVSHNMTIPAERLVSAKYAFHISIVTFLFSLFQIPYLAMILANEDMGIYALVSCVDCVLKLLSAFLIIYSPCDSLVFYSFCMLIVALLTFISYVINCHVRYDECRYRKVEDKRIYIRLIKFVGWTSLGSISGVGLIQGSIIILNVFFGPLTNAAFGVANNVYNAFMSLGNSVNVAFRPAIIKCYASNDISTLDRLFPIGNKLLQYLLLAIAIPLISEMKQILLLWLDSSDEQTVLFCRLFILFGIVISMGVPISNIVQASGRLRRYYFTTEIILMLHIPLSLAFFGMGMPVYFIFISMLLMCLVSHIIRVQMLKRYYVGFSPIKYYVSLFAPAFLIISVSYVLSFVFDFLLGNNLFKTIVFLFFAPIQVLVMAYVLGTSKMEREGIVHFFNRIIKR